MVNIFLKIPLSYLFKEKLFCVLLFFVFWAIGYFFTPWNTLLLDTLHLGKNNYHLKRPMGANHVYQMRLTSTLFH